MTAFRPPVNAILNRGHSLAQGLRICVPFWEGSGTKVFDAARGALLDHSTGATAYTWSEGGLWLGKSYAVLEIANAIAEPFFQTANGYTVVCLAATSDGTDFDGYWGFTDDLLYQEVSGNVRLRQEGTQVLTGTFPIDGLMHFHQGVRHSGGTLEAFVDGVSQGTSSATAALDTVSDLHIGSYYGNLAGGKDALFRGFWVWDRALTAPEILAHQADPWAMFRRPSRIFLFGGGGTPPAPSAGFKVRRYYDQFLAGGCAR